jgi:7,8-dihydroneopterin aldolase/epimerase/oxygenase
VEGFCFILLKKRYICGSKARKMGIIEIEDMEFFAYHGCFKEEQIVGNRFVVNLSITADCQEAAASDKLSEAIDYQKAYLIVKAEMKQKSFLLEHVAARILNSLYLQFPQIIQATVKVSKINPPMGGQMKNVSVTMSR